MGNSFQMLGQNSDTINDNFMSLVHWPEDGVGDDLPEQAEVIEVSVASEENSNKGKKDDESASA